VRRSKDRKQDAPERALTGGSDLADEAAERLATIVNAAERAAEQVIDDAEGRAREILAEANVEAERIRDEALAAVERARRELTALTDGAALPSRGNHLSAVPVAAADPVAPVEAAELEPEFEPSAESESDFEPGPVSPLGGPRPGSPERGTPAGARLLATQMAVSGSSREEIEARLRSGFEIEDTQAILDAILGPED
jgi:hypothetical protein